MVSYILTQCGSNTLLNTVYSDGCGLHFKINESITPRNRIWFGK